MLHKLYPNGYRLKHYELFDISNMTPDGNLAPPDSMKAAFSKVPRPQSKRVGGTRDLTHAG